MGGKSALLIIAIVLIIISPSLSFYVVPSMKKYPSDLDMVIYYDGKLGMLNMSTLTMNYRNIEIQRHVKALQHEGNVLIIREDINVFNADNGKELPEFHTVKIYGINERTAENIKGYGDLDRLGYWLFPVGIEKKNYAIWNSDLDEACKKGYISPQEAVATAYYDGVEYVHGIKCYKYYGGQHDVYIGPLPDLPEAKMYYSGEQQAWVDVVTGAIINLAKHVKQDAQFPDLHKLPSNLNKTVLLCGKVKILNTTTGLPEEYNITVSNHIKVLNASSSYYIVENDIVAEDEDGKVIKEISSSSKDAVNPVTMEYMKFLSNKRGLMTFPIGVERKNYELWNGEINNVSVAVYSGEENIGGIDTYKFIQNARDVYIEKQSLPGLSDRFVELYYNGSTIYYVEPVSGSIVYIEKNGRVISHFPNLHTIPEDFNTSLKMEGSLWIISQPKKNIVMNREIKVKNVYFEKGRKILLLEDNTTTYDAKKMEKIEEGCKVEYHGVDADTAMEVKNYGDMDRDGYFSFPVGVEKRTYNIWNTEINAVSPAYFVREEEHDGVHTYLFETSEKRILYDSTPGIEQNIMYITDTKYWVEPNTGMVVDMHKQSVKKINPLEMLLGIRGWLWIDVYKLNVSFSQDTINSIKSSLENKINLVKLSNSSVEALNISIKTENIDKSIEEAKHTKAMIEKLSGNRVTVADLSYHMSDESIEEMADKAKQSSFLLLMLQVIIPLFLILVAIMLIAVYIRK
ncbi:MAG: DUF3068 domain-containing protein [Thermoplasmata archaeon]|nr:DUF3068 domain-containing protein [Thermoplasmata archaeon]